MVLTVIHLNADDPRDGERLDAVLSGALAGVAHEDYPGADALPDLRGRRILFAVALGEYGVNAAYTRLLRRLRAEPAMLDGCTAALVVDGGGELYTKSIAAELGLAANLAGSALIGRPLVEATGSLTNFRVRAKLLGADLAGAYRATVRELVDRLLAAELPKKERPELLALHASSYHTSNTMRLWGQVKTRLGGGFSVTEIGLRNGAVSDCAGCPYTACLHFGEKDRCFYGGLMQDEVWPAVRRCDAVVLLCPNYNDALSANLTAFINRLTGLFRQTRFYDKAVFAIVVSGYSGGDIVARQLVSAMNMNKSFYLPPRFALLETANDPGEALMLPGIEGRLADFTQRIRATLAWRGTDAQRGGYDGALIENLSDTCGYPAAKSRRCPRAGGGRRPGLFPLTAQDICDLGQTRDQGEVEEILRRQIELNTAIAGESVRETDQEIIRMMTERTDRPAAAPARRRTPPYPPCRPDPA